MTIAQIIGLVVVLILAVLCGVLIVKKSTKHSLFKWVFLFIGVAIAMTWIFEAGYFQEAAFMGYGLIRQGLTDFPNILYQAVHLAGDKVMFLLALGCFYAVLSRVGSYRKLVTTIAEKFKGKEYIFVILVSLLLTVMTAFFAQTFAVLIFVPFLVSILLNMKLDKISAFATTFGSMLIGTMGTIYGTEGAYWFNYYTQTSANVGLVYRLIILVVGFILFNLFNILHVKKVLKDKVNEVEVDPFKVEKADKKVRIWPMAIVLGLLFILLILGYMPWAAELGVNAFVEFHNWLTTLKIGEFEVFNSILGSLSNPFGSWSLFNATTLITCLSVLIALIGRVSLDEFFEAYAEGFKKMVKPTALFIAAYMVMVVAYVSPFMPTIANLMFKSVSSFNPYLVSLGGLISNIFHIDFGYTGFAIGSYFMTTYAENMEVVHTIFTTLFGWVGIVVPTQAILLIGLSYLDIDYKTWIKYIWIFAVAMLVILLILFTIITYV